MRTRLPLLFALLALFAGCGGDEESTPSTAASGDVVEVRMKDIKFVPATVTAKVGQTIRWTNDDAVDHDVKAQSGADFSSDLIGKGKTFEAKVDKAGTVAYVCTIHPGQKGSVTVEG